MSPTLRRQRLRLPWLLALPFLYLAHPTTGTLLWGALLAAPGLLLRGWASGYIDKDRTLAVHGPYARIRHPLYLGSFMAGAGLVVAGGVWALSPAFLLLFLWIHVRTVRAEEAELATRFGEDFQAYRRSVPALIPGSGRRWDKAGEGVEGDGASRDGSGGFSPALFRRNRGWDGPLGMAGGFLLLWLKMVMAP